jgi:hypothetical protein
MHFRAEAVFALCVILNAGPLVAQNKVIDSTIEHEIIKLWPGGIRPVTYFYVVPLPNDLHGARSGRPCSFGPGGYHFYDYCPSGRQPDWDMFAIYNQSSAATWHGLGLNERPPLFVPSGRVLWPYPYAHAFRISSFPVLYNPRTGQLLAGSPSNLLFEPDFRILRKPPSLAPALGPR